jgi:hypothetical protein
MLISVNSRLVRLRISIGGADTTTSMMACWPFAMIVCPRTQARAHEELDAVVGHTRLSTFVVPTLRSRHG